MPTKAQLEQEVERLNDELEEAREHSDFLSTYYDADIERTEAAHTKDIEAMASLARYRGTQVQMLQVAIRKIQGAVDRGMHPRNGLAIDALCEVALAIPNR